MTPAWTSGYVSDIPYTLGFYRELAPAFLNYVCLISGVEGLDSGRSLRYCELGCGRGFGTTLLAAANPDLEFVGIDFNPTHINEARALATRAGLSNINFLELSFADIASSTEPLLAEFDIIALHGVFSWLAPSGREDIIKVLNAKLRPGGLAFISYNTLPGWAAMAAAQRLLKEYADRATGDSLARLAKGRAVLNELTQKSSAFIAQNPTVKSRIEFFDKQDPNYLSHEFLNDHWEPLYVSDVMENLAEAKLTFVGSATIGENRLALCVPNDLIALVESAPDLALRELLKDFAINKQFRRDVYSKGRLRLAESVLKRRYHELGFALTSDSPKLPEKWPVPSGEANLKSEVVEPIISRLRQEPARGAELIEIAAETGVGEADVATILEILIHNGAVAPCRPNFGSVDRGSTERLNRAILDLAFAGDTHKFLATPVLGSAISTNYLERVAASVLCENEQLNDVTAAGTIFDRLDKVGSRLIRDGTPMDRSEESLRELENLVLQFRTVTLPAWQRLGILQ